MMFLNVRASDYQGTAAAVRYLTTRLTITNMAVFNQ
jgi:hypothetical protein